jgi:hypothetical protein
MPTVEGISFSREVDAVNDLGLDNTGNTPINDTLNTELEGGDVLVTFPPGDYYIDPSASAADGTGSDGEVFTFIFNSNPATTVGMRGSTGDRTDVRFVFGNETPYEYYWWNMQHGTDVLWKDFTIQQDDGVDVNVNNILHIEDNLIVKNVELGGYSSPDPYAHGSKIKTAVKTEDGSATFTRYVSRGGGIGPDGYPTRKAQILLLSEHTGLLRLVDCYFEQGGSHAFYASNHNGAVQVEGGMSYNCDNTNVRLGGSTHPTHDSWLKNYTIYIDTDAATLKPASFFPDSSSGAFYENTRGLKMEMYNTNGPLLIEDCDFYMKSSPNAEYFMGIEQNFGGPILRNVRARQDVGNGIPFFWGKDAYDSHPDKSVNFDQVQFTYTGTIGSPENAAIYLEDRDGSDITNSCIYSENEPVLNTVNTSMGTEDYTTSGCTLPDVEPTWTEGIDPRTQTQSDGGSTSTFTIEGLAGSSCGDYVMEYSFDVSGGDVTFGPRSGGSGEGSDTITDNGDGTFSISGITSDGNVDDWVIDDGATIQNWSATFQSDGTAIPAECYELDDDGAIIDPTTDFPYSVGKESIAADVATLSVTAPLPNPTDTSVFTITGLTGTTCGDFVMTYTFDVVGDGDDDDVDFGPNSGGSGEGTDEIVDNGDGTYTVNGLTSDGNIDNWIIEDGAEIRNWAAEDNADGTVVPAECYELDDDGTVVDPTTDFPYTMGSTASTTVAADTGTVSASPLVGSLSLSAASASADVGSVSVLGQSPSTSVGPVKVISRLTDDAPPTVTTSAPEPSVVTGVGDIVADTATVSLSGPTASLAGGGTATVEAATATVATEVVPPLGIEVVAATRIAAGVGSVSLSGPSPSPSATGVAGVEADVAALVASHATADVSKGSATMVAPESSLVASQPPASVSAVSNTVEAGVVSVDVTGPSPAVSQSETVVEADVAELSLSGPVATFGLSVAVYKLRGESKVTYTLRGEAHEG